MTLEHVATPTTNTDWNCFSQVTGFIHTVTAPTGCKVTTGATNTAADPNGEVEWVSGQKFDTRCPALSTGNNPPKDEFVDVASYSDSDASNNVFFYGGAIRSSANGNASGDVEFNQAAGDDVATAGCRTAGDRLLAYDFLNGGTNLNFHVLTWIDNSNPPGSTTGGGNSGTCFVKTNVMPCWGAHVTTVSAALFDGESNQAAILAANNALNGAALAVNQFSEFGVNLTQALGLTGCINFPQQVWESRSSGSSFTSNPQDIEFQHRRIQTCGEIKIIKQTDPRGQDQAFSFASSLPARDSGGVACVPAGDDGIDASGNFCLNDADNSSLTAGSTSAANNSAGNTMDATNVQQGTYTVTEGADPGAFTFASVSCSADSTSGSTVSTSSKTATIHLSPSGVVTCLYTNALHQGAILITKTGKNKNCIAAGTPSDITGVVCTGSASAKLGGATFKITSDPAGADVVTGASALTTSNTTGTVCFDGLAWSGTGTTYYVTETGAPTGYAVSDATAQSASVTQNAKCSDSDIAATATGKSFSDAPLTDLSVHVQAQAAGSTRSSISCVVDGTPTNVGTSRQPASGTQDNITVNADAGAGHGGGLTPGTYVCTVVVDP